MRSQDKSENLEFAWDPLACIEIIKKKIASNTKIDLAPYFKFLREIAPSTLNNTSKSYGPIDKVFEL